MTAALPSVHRPTVPWPALAWALTVTLITTVLLGVFAELVFVADALTYGVAEVISPEADLEAPDLARYVTAFCVSSTLAVGGGLLLTLALARTTAAGWPSPARGLTAGVTSAVAAALTMLLMLGINPLDFLS